MWRPLVLSTISAVIADSTPPEKRSKGMALIGMARASPMRLTM